MPFFYYPLILHGSSGPIPPAMAIILGLIMGLGGVALTAVAIKMLVETLPCLKWDWVEPVLLFCFSLCTLSMVVIGIYLFVCGCAGQTLQ